MAVTNCMQETLYLNQLICAIDTVFIKNVVTIFSDSQSAISLAHNPISHNRSKHIDIKYHFIRQHISYKSVKLMYIATEFMLADFLTKPVGKNKLIWSCKLM